MRPPIIKKIKSAPKCPGVYIFYDGRQILYIGKATNLRARLRSYLKTTDQKTAILDEQATKLRLIECPSPIVALIEEAKLIKQLEPRLNVYWRDDKQYFYVAFTSDKFPRVYVTHQPRGVDCVGPFIDGRALKLILRILRRHCPYCSCKQLHQRQCLNSQMGFCPGYCCVKSEKKTSAKNLRLYKKNIKTIKDVLSGRRKALLTKIIQPGDLWAAENILEHASLITTSSTVIKEKVECYDISNLSGKEAVGVMTTLTNESGIWTTNKKDWRTFRIKSGATRDDPRMIAEILERRLNHPEWTYPDLIVIDGGKTQYNAAASVIATANSGNLNIEKFKSLNDRQQGLLRPPKQIRGPRNDGGGVITNERSERSNLSRHPLLISFAKPKKEIVGLKKLSKKDQQQIKELEKQLIIEKIIKQTHGFAIRTHRRLRDKQFTLNFKRPFEVKSKIKTPHQSGA